MVVQRGIRDEMYFISLLMSICHAGLRFRIKKHLIFYLFILILKIFKNHFFVLGSETLKLQSALQCRVFLLV